MGFFKREKEPPVDTYTQWEIDNIYTSLKREDFAVIRELAPYKKEGLPSYMVASRALLVPSEVRTSLSKLGELGLTSVDPEGMCLLNQDAIAEVSRRNPTLPASHVQESLF